MRAARVPSLLFLVLMTTMRPALAPAVPVAVGDLSLNVLSFPNILIAGTITFDDATFPVFGNPVNLGTDVGTANFSGEITSFNFFRGEFSADFASATNGQLSFHESGSFLCDASSGCLSGDPASLVGDVTGVMGSAVSDLLPLDLVYIGDGTVAETGSLLFEGRVALNAFQPVSTPTGTNQTVSSSTTFFSSQTGDAVAISVDVTYANVISGGATVITAVSNVAGQLAENFSLGGLPAAFFDVSTTAQVSGPITICTHYPDADNDGVVDGTGVPGVDEHSLALLHGVGGEFGDVTNYPLDDVNNVICGTVTSLSPFVVAVRLNDAPDCSAALVSPDQLWPANHKFVNVAVTGVTDPDGDVVTTAVTGITQDESLNGLRDGNTCPDASGVGTSTASLRAERSGRGDGRVYHVSFTSSDGNGGQCTGTVTVCVPHDQRAGRFCTDQGPLVGSTDSCS